MDRLIELAPIVLGSIGLVSLVAATIVRIVSKAKRQSKVYVVLTIVGFFSLFLAAGIAVWSIFASF